MLLEQLLHPESCFVTLTYSPENLPAGGVLVPRDTELFLKRLRKRFEPLKLRYFLTGEYGDESWRPHYHAILYNVPLTAHREVDAAWGLGGVHVGEANRTTMQYVAGYVVKKLTSDSALSFVERCDLVPEFARMSRNPGLGRGAISGIASALGDAIGAREVGFRGDIPGELRIGGKKLPLGRYLKTKLAEELGYDEELLSQGRMEKYAMEMLPLLQDQKSRDFEAEKRGQAALNTLARNGLLKRRSL